MRSPAVDVCGRRKSRPQADDRRHLVVDHWTHDRPTERDHEKAPQMSELQPPRHQSRLALRQGGGVGLLVTAAVLVVACGGGGKSSSSATTPTPRSASPPSSPSSLNLAPKGNQLLFNTNALTAKAGKVTIDFPNSSPLQHN